jgi:hypothetical protein
VAAATPGDSAAGDRVSGVAPWPQSVIAGLGQDQEPETRTPMSLARWQSRRSESVTSPSDGGGPARRGPPTAFKAAPPGRSAVCGIRHCPQLVRPGCPGPELSHCKSLSRLLPLALTGTIPHNSELGLGLSPSHGHGASRPACLGMPEKSLSQP